MSRSIDIWGNNPLRLNIEEEKTLIHRLSSYFHTSISYIEWINKGRSGAQIFIFEVNNQKKIIKLQTKKRCIREKAGYFHLSRKKVPMIRIGGIRRQYEIYGLILDFHEGKEIDRLDSEEQHILICSKFNDFFAGEEVYSDIRGKKKIIKFCINKERKFDRLNFPLVEREKFKTARKHLLCNYSCFVKVHGDPSLKNIIINQGVPQIIDYGNFSVLPLETQKARFLNSLLLRKKSISCEICEKDLLQPVIIYYQICDLIRRIESDFYDVERVKEEYQLCKELLKKI
ncbi:TPA: hypothetical protein ACGOTT_000504 [Streptococcus suis]